MKKELLVTVKEFFEDSLATGEVFDMGDIYEYAKSLYPDTTVQELGEVMSKLQAKGEILWEAHSSEQGKYYAAPPPNPQVTVFGADSGAPAKKTKEPAADTSKRFTKKQKEAALLELQAITELTPGLAKLHDWLYEQVHG